MLYKAQWIQPTIEWINYSNLTQKFNLRTLKSTSGQTFVEWAAALIAPVLHSPPAANNVNWQWFTTKTGRGWGGGDENGWKWNNMKPFKGWLSANDADIRVPQTHHIDGFCGEILHHKPTLKFYATIADILRDKWRRGYSASSGSEISTEVQHATTGGKGGANKLKLNFVFSGYQFTIKILLAKVRSSSPGLFTRW